MPCPSKWGVISSPHPHAPMHVKTLEVLPEVTAIHLCGVADEDTDALGEGRDHGAIGDDER